MWLGREVGRVLRGTIVVLGLALIVVVVLLTLWVVNPSPGQRDNQGRRYGRW
jgi:hypothetical protein